MPRITFPFTYIGKTKLGKIFRPYAIVEIFSSKRKKWQPVEMIIDTGADYCLFPKRYADIFGIDIQKDCEPEKTLGVGGNVPPLLGRLDCIELFRLIFEEKKSIFELYA